MTAGRVAAGGAGAEVPEDPKRDSVPFDAASRPHLVAPFGDDLSSQMSIWSGRPSWHVPFTASTATLVPSSVPAAELSTESGPDRLRIDISFSGLPEHGTVVVVLPPAAFDDDPLSSPLLPQAASSDASVTSTRMRTPRARGAMTMVPPPSPEEAPPPGRALRKKDYSRHHGGPDGPSASTLDRAGGSVGCRRHPT